MQRPFDPFADLRFDNSFVRELPADPVEGPETRKVEGAAYSRVRPTPVADPKLVAWSREVAEFLGLPAEPPPEVAQVLAGNRVTEGMDPWAACYGGHQFGNWAGQLGDGRAISLGEVLDADDARWELQLKGAGQTPYSRHSDGRAVLRSSIREFLCSEAMFHLGVPTTRALSLVTTGDAVVRDMLYDGHPAPEPGAIVCRVAPSFLRFGNFEILSARDDPALLRKLADYAIHTHFPALAEEHEPGPALYAKWFSTIAESTAEMIAHWMRVGFVHGVMNTDNMSILGLTIDYGPYGWIDDYDPDWTPNTTDAQGRRYRFGHQPRIAAWNLWKLASALYPLVGDAEPLEEGLDAYSAALERHTLRMCADKLGLVGIDKDEEVEDPASGIGLVNEGIGILSATSTDMTIFYRRLADVSMAEEADADTRLTPLAEAYYDSESVSPALRERTAAWLGRLSVRVRREAQDPAKRRAQMKRANPKYVMRNYLAQLAIDAAENDDPSKVVELLDVMRRPYDDQAGREEYAAKRPEWAKHRVGCSMLSCSS